MIKKILLIAGSVICVCATVASAIFTTLKIAGKNGSKNGNNGSFTSEELSQAGLTGDKAEIGEHEHKYVEIARNPASYSEGEMIIKKCSICGHLIIEDGAGPLQDTYNLIGTEEADNELGQIEFYVGENTKKKRVLANVENRRFYELNKIRSERENEMAIIRIVTTKNASDEDYNNVGSATYYCAELEMSHTHIHKWELKPENCFGGLDRQAPRFVYTCSVCGEEHTHYHNFEFVSSDYQNTCIGKIDFFRCKDCGLTEDHAGSGLFIKQTGEMVNENIHICDANGHCVGLQGVMSDYGVRGGDCDHSNHQTTVIDSRAIISASKSISFVDYKNDDDMLSYALNKNTRSELALNDNTDDAYAQLVVEKNAKVLALFVSVEGQNNSSISVFVNEMDGKIANVNKHIMGCEYTREDGTLGYAEIFFISLTDENGETRNIVAGEKLQVRVYAQNVSSVNANAYICK